MQLRETNSHLSFQQTWTYSWSVGYYLIQIRSDLSLDWVVVGKTWSTHYMTASACEVCPLSISPELCCPVWSTPSDFVINISTVSCVFWIPLAKSSLQHHCSEWCGRTTQAFFFSMPPTRFSCLPTRALWTNWFALRSFYEIPKTRQSDYTW